MPSAPCAAAGVSGVAGAAEAGPHLPPGARVIPSQPEHRAGLLL